MRAWGLVLAFGMGAAVLQFPPGVAAQGVAARLAGRVPPNVAQAVEGLALDAAARGLPVEPLIQKALEGSAKGVPGERVILAVRALSARLDEARGALRSAGIRAPTPAALESGADALNAGMTARQVGEVGRVSRPPYEPALTLRVAATLAALGVPPDRGLRLMTRMIQAGRGPGDLLELAIEVQVGMARGATAAEALGELDAAYGGGTQDQHGPQEQQGEQEHEDREGEPSRRP